jgi:hypothetical protein
MNQLKIFDCVDFYKKPSKAIKLDMFETAYDFINFFVTLAKFMFHRNADRLVILSCILNYQVIKA